MPLYYTMIMADNAIIKFNQSNHFVVTNAAGVVYKQVLQEVVKRVIYDIMVRENPCRGYL